MQLILKSQNQNLAANLIKPEKSFKKHLPALIFIHGWKSNQKGNIKRATEISKLGFICLTLDLRGHGESEGKINQFSRKDHLQDIKTAFEYLSNLPEVDIKKIGIIGASYGGYLSAVAANFLKFNKIILRVPALYGDQDFDTPTDKLIEKDPLAFKTSGLKPQNSLALKGIQNFKGKILLIESEKDKVIPHKVIENYVEHIDKKNLTYELMKNTPHSLETEKQEKEYLTILSEFFKKFDS